MKEILSRFGGVVPRIENASKLASYSATRAQDVDLTSGSLVPIVVDPPFQSLHNQDGSMKPGLDWGDLISVPAPDPVTVYSRITQCIPTTWLSIDEKMYETHVTAANAFTANTLSSLGGVNSWTYKIAGDRLIITARRTGWKLNLTAGIAYSIRGPVYQFSFTADTAFFGGPDAAVKYPDTLYWSSGTVTPFKIPLTYPVTMDDYPTVTTDPRYIYAYLTLIDYSVPTTAPTLTTDVDVSDYEVLEFHESVFTFKIDYVRPQEQFAYYIQSHADLSIGYGEYDATESTTAIVKLKEPLQPTSISVPSTGILRHEDGTVIDDYTSYSYNAIDELHEFTMAAAVSVFTEDDKIEIIDTSLDGDAGREGPPSEVSTLISIDPGEILLLQTDKQTDSTAKTKLYRSSTGADGSFGLLSDDASSGTSARYYDTFLLPLGEVLPPYGNYENATKEGALAGSILHPASWSAIFKDNILYPSDIDRPWVFPDEFTKAFDTDIMALAVTGNTILVFTEGRDTADVTEQGKVFAVTGNNPQYLASYELSNAHPLLNKIGLGKIGDAVYWPTIDGLARSTGGPVELVTERFFTRKQWLDESPYLMSCYTAENSVWIINAEGHNWKVDFDEMNGQPFTFLSTFTAFSGKQLIYETKPFSYPRPMAFSHIRVEAEDYPVGISLMDLDGQIRASMLVLNDKVGKLPKMRREREWKVRINSNFPVLEVGLATTAAELGP